MKNYEFTIPQKIKFWWSNAFAARQLFYTLHKSYSPVSSTVTTTRTKDHDKTLRVGTRDKVSP